MVGTNGEQGGGDERSGDDGSGDDGNGDERSGDDGNGDERSDDDANGDGGRDLRSFGSTSPIVSKKLLAFSMESKYWDFISSRDAPSELTFWVEKIYLTIGPYPDWLI